MRSEQVACASRQHPQHDAMCVRVAIVLCEAKHGAWHLSYVTMSARFSGLAIQQDTRRIVDPLGAGRKPKAGRFAECECVGGPRLLAPRRANNNIDIECEGGCVESYVGASCRSSRSSSLRLSRLFGSFLRDRLRR